MDHTDAWTFKTEQQFSCRKFVLSDWIERSDGNDSEGINISKFKK